MVFARTVACSTLSASRSSVFVWRTRYTAPIPPRPTHLSTRYRPAMTVPGASSSAASAIPDHLLLHAIPPEHEEAFGNHREVHRGHTTYACTDGDRGTRVEATADADEVVDV